LRTYFCRNFNLYLLIYCLVIDPLFLGNDPKFGQILDIFGQIRTFSGQFGGGYFRGGGLKGRYLNLDPPNSHKVCRHVCQKVGHKFLQIRVKLSVIKLASDNTRCRKKSDTCVHKSLRKASKSFVLLAWSKATATLSMDCHHCCALDVSQEQYPSYKKSSFAVNEP
jgi:hypothetical protein